MNSQEIAIEDVLCEFFEILIHNIIHVRKLYPESIFELKKKYGIPVYQCILSELTEYINGCLKAIKFHLTKRQLQKIFICFLVDEEVVEKYTFDVIDYNNLIESDCFLVELEQSMRSCLLKLNSSQSYLSELPDNTSFQIRLQTSFYSTVEFSQDPNFELCPWIQIKESDNSVISAEIIPLHTIDTQFFNVQLYIEKETL